MQQEDKRKTLLIYAAIGTLTGFANGLFGAGGGMLLVPALTHFCHLEQQKAQATALAVILPLSLLSALLYWYHGFLPPQETLWVAPGSIAGAAIGAWLLPKLSSAVARRIFAGLMFAAGLGMLLT